MYRAVWCWLSRIERFPTSSHPNSAFVMNPPKPSRSEEHTSELQSQSNLVCRLLLEKKNKMHVPYYRPQAEPCVLLSALYHPPKARQLQLLDTVQRCRRYDIVLQREVRVTGDVTPP